MRWQWTLICGLSLLPVGAAGLRAETLLLAPTTLPATRPADPDDQLPVMDAPNIASVVKLSIANKFLQMTTDLPITDGQMRVRVTNFPGKTIATVTPAKDAPDDKSLATISITHTMPMLPNQTVIYTMFTTGGDDVRLSVDSEDSSTLRSVQFIQTPVMAANPDPDEKPVRLYVTITDMVNNSKTVDLKLTADSVVELRRKYPRETAEYFQPLLATLGQEAVPFAVDRRTAWQVLSKHWPVDPKADEQVKEIVKKLDADDFAIREAAAAELEKLGENAVQAVTRTPREKLSFEQNSSLDAFLSKYHPLKDDEAKRLATDVPFLLDCLYSEPLIRDTAMKQLREVTGKPIDLDTKASPGAWLTMVRNLRKELLPPPATKPAEPVPVQ